MDIQMLEKQLKAVADANRLTLLSCLKSGEVCVCDLVELCLDYHSRQSVNN